MTYFCKIAKVTTCKKVTEKRATISIIALKIEAIKDQGSFKLLYHFFSWFNSEWMGVFDLDIYRETSLNRGVFKCF